MAYGMIKKIQVDPVSNTFSGSLLDLDTQKEFAFQDQTGLEEVNRLDVVTYSDAGGTATGLKPDWEVRVAQWNQQTVDVQDAVRNLLKALIYHNNGNTTTVAVRKF